MLAPPVRKHSKWMTVRSPLAVGSWSTDMTGLTPIAGSRTSILLWQSGQVRPRADT